MRRWLTIFPDLKKEHLNKDVGLIPEIMQYEGKYKSSILTINRESDVSEYTSCNVIEIDENKLGKKISIAKYLIKNAKQYDVINMYHFSLSEALLWVLPYKMRNPKGKVYLKMDLSTKYMHDYTNNKIMLFLRKMVLPLYSLITVESSIVCDYVNKYYKNKVKLIPNGYYWGTNSLLINKNRKNEILYVARIGADCKRTEILIEAFERTLNQHNWMLHLVGPMEDSFKLWYEKKLDANSSLKDRIIYDGAIYDRERIEKLYDETKIFSLCSEYESFGIVLIEALSKGAYLIATEGINSSRDIIKNKNIGLITKTNDVNDLARNILKAINAEEIFDDDKVEFRIQYAKEKYLWTNICKKINHFLDGD